MNCRPRQPTNIPLNGAVDTTPFHAVVNHPIHQRSYHRRQLGLVHVAYPGACHSRGEHELGSCETTSVRASYWLKEGTITEQDAIDSVIHALVHDDPHGPYSHITDPLVGNDHNQRARPIIEAMADAIKQSGGNPERIIQMMEKKDPLGVTVSHPLLGTEKLDYLRRDSHHTGIAGMLDIGQFLSSVYYIEGKVVADASIHQLVISLLSHFWTMYDQVYYLEQVVITERFMQRMISMLLGQSGEEAEVSEEELLQMVDSQLDYLLQHAKDKTIRKHYQRYLDRDTPVPIVLCQRDPFHLINWSPNAPIIHLPAPDDVFSERLRNPRLLHKLERDIEKEFKLPRLSVLVTPAAPKRRFQPPEVLFQTNSGIKHMRELDTLGWQASIATAERHARFYVAVDYEQSSQFGEASKAQTILEIVTLAAERD